MKPQCVIFPQIMYHVTFWRISCVLLFQGFELSKANKLLAVALCKFKLMLVFFPKMSSDFLQAGSKSDWFDILSSFFERWIKSLFCRGKLCFIFAAVAQQNASPDSGADTSCKHVADFKWAAFWGGSVTACLHFVYHLSCSIHLRFLDLSLTVWFLLFICFFSI